MAHQAQIDYINSVKDNHPKFFKNKSVLDVGSMDINGNNTIHFNDCDYLGLDIGEGKNVDIVCPIHKFVSFYKFDVVISTEMLEHDKYWIDSLKAMYDLLKPKGMLLITAAGSKRKEHGTTRTSPLSSPFTNDYYCNITKEMFEEAFNLNKDFISFNISSGWNGKDIYFLGFKK